MMTTSNTAAPGGTSVIDSAAPETVGAALRHLVETALRPIRYTVCYRGQVRVLTRLDAHLLRDIGVRPWDVDAAARDLAEAKVPACGSLGDAVRAVLRAARHLLGAIGARRDSIGQPVVYGRPLLSPASRRNASAVTASAG